MKLLHVHLEWQIATYKFGSNELADEAYKTIKKALDEYRRFKNDISETVTFKSECGETTLRIESIRSVGIDDLDMAEPVIIAHEVWRETIKSKIAARLAPAPPAG